MKLFFKKILIKYAIGSLLVLFAIGYGFLTTSFIVHAEALKDFNIIPEAKSSYPDAVEHLGDPKKGDFWNMYQYFGQTFDKKEDIGSSFASGIFTRDTIILFVSRLARWIANVALVAGAACVIYAGYLYATSVFTGDASGKANDAIKYAAIGIGVITLAYGILRIAIAAFL